MGKIGGAGLRGGGGDIWKITGYSRPWGLDKVSAKTIQVQKATLSGDIQGEAFNKINIFFLTDAIYFQCKRLEEVASLVEAL